MDVSEQTVDIFHDYVKLWVVCMIECKTTMFLFSLKTSSSYSDVSGGTYNLSQDDDLSSNDTWEVVLELMQLPCYEL